VDTTTDDVRTAELRREIEHRRQDLGRDLEVIGDRVSPGRMADRSRERTRRRVVGLRDRLMGTTQPPARTTFGDDEPGLRDRVAGAASGLTDHDPASAVQERVQGSPIAMGMVAFGIGFVAGSVIPPSRSERELAHRLEPGITQLAEGVAQQGREVGEHLAPAARDEAQALKGEASKAAGHVAQSGREEASTARQEMSS
jgi:hypothetical protein